MKLGATWMYKYNCVPSHGCHFSLQTFMKSASFWRGALCGGGVKAFSGEKLTNFSMGIGCKHQIKSFTFQVMCQHPCLSQTKDGIKDSAKETLLYIHKLQKIFANVPQKGFRWVGTPNLGEGCVGFVF